MPRTWSATSYSHHSDSGDGPAPWLVALNMTDVAEDQGTRVNPKLLAERLGCPVIPMMASRGQGVAELKDCLDGVLSRLPSDPRPRWSIPR